MSDCNKCPKQEWCDNTKVMVVVSVGAMGLDLATAITKVMEFWAEKGIVDRDWLEAHRGQEGISITDVPVNMQEFHRQRAAATHAQSQAMVNSTVDSDINDVLGSIERGDPQE
jgi:hypothetical protein